MTSQAEFIEIVWEYYRKHGRDLPWRNPEANGDFDPYKIMVSEVMLQQTQAKRVIPKYHEFLQRFPTMRDLAEAELSEVLTAWSGLGYNRRAKFLWQAAQAVNGEFPTTLEGLIALPGIGKNTAGAIQAYSFNQPVVFIETNVRTVYIHHFFAGRDDVDDKEITELVAATVDKEHPREWYWAIMDYGSHLKATVGNTSRYSKHHTKQSKFEGSGRQIRGKVIKLLIQRPYKYEELVEVINDSRLDAILNQLTQEELVGQQDSTYRLC